MARLRGRGIPLRVGLVAATLLLVARCAWLANRNLGRGHLLAKLSGAWFASIMLQVFLGAATIWTGKSADIARTQALTMSKSRGRM